MHMTYVGGRGVRNKPAEGLKIQISRFFQLGFFRYWRSLQAELRS